LPIPYLLLFVQRNLWRNIQTELAIWRVGALPGLIIIGLVMLARLTGSLQFFEWVALDNFLRLRPAEPMDERIVIVGIDEGDIQQIRTYPIPDQDIAELLRLLQNYQPNVIGLDIFRDLPVEPGHAKLVEVFRESKNLIAIEKALRDREGFTVSPPPDFSPDQAGFADAVLDTDGYLRRSLLRISTPQGERKLSLTLRLAQTYLSSQGIPLEQGIHDPNAIRFGSTELTRFQPNSGGYVRADAGGNQILLNFRSGREPFRVISLNDIKSGHVDPNWIRDRIVLVGITAASVKDSVNSAAITGVNPKLVYGAEIQAHAVSQIISAVLDGRPLLQVWSDGWEYLWIFAWGFLGISLGRLFQSPFKILMGLGMASVGLIGICYFGLIVGWWIPLVPAILPLVFNGAGLTAGLFYRHQQDLRLRLQERQFIIDHTFDTIHNGPLQRLARILSTAQENHLYSELLLSELKQLNQEIRTVYESVRRETLTQGEHIYLGGNLELDLHAPLHESLYQVYDNTITRDFPCFQTIKFKINKFEPLESRYLSLDQKRGLCRFLEEALCNVGKYAVGVTRLSVICTQENGENVLRIIDNGVGLEALSDNLDQYRGRGTQQAKNLARQLRGTFRRFPNSPKGTVCELTWSVAKAWFW
jgi:CHASE2 domain-containing sensor protein